MYTKYYSTRKTSQSQPIPGSGQVSNSAGGFVWGIDDWQRLDWFLILGAEGGTYYVKEQQLVIENASAVLRCIKIDGPRVVDRVVEISIAARAPKNDPALFVLAMCAGLGDDKTRAWALECMPAVARTGTHLFTFLEYAKAFRGWGRGMREAVSAWYNDKSPDDLAYQLLKYRQRGGWTHRDALRLAHPKPVSAAHDALYRYVTKMEWPMADDGEPGPKMPDILWGYSMVQTADLVEKKELPEDLAHHIKQYKLTREMIPTEYLNHKEVWAALLDAGMPMTAMLRNLGKMTSIGLLQPLSVHTSYVAERLTDESYWSRDWSTSQSKPPHPFAILTALRVYQQGHGMLGSLTWEPVSKIVDALDEMFYLSFGAVEPTGKNILQAIDVSGSMSAPLISGYDKKGREMYSPVSCRDGAMAMAMVTARTEPNQIVTIFNAAGGGFMASVKSNSLWQAGRGISLWDVSPRQRLDDIVRRVSSLPHCGTDCSLPMLYAHEKGWHVDVFILYTDNETWAGKIHPSQALREYRRAFNPDARLIVVGMASNGFSIADPNDAGMLDVVGFDTAVPGLIRSFTQGEV